MTHTKYVAIINTPGYMSEQDELPTFDTAREAWEYLAEERMRAEEAAEDDDGAEWSDTVDTLGALGEEAHWRHSEHGVWLAENGFNPDGTGTVYGGTPGGAMYDLGVAYSVQLAEEGE